LEANRKSNIGQMSEMTEDVKIVDDTQGLRETGLCPACHEAKVQTHQTPDGEEAYCPNVHGHIHGNRTLSNKHFNVSVENINYTPISLKEVLKQIELDFDITEEVEG